MENISEIEKLNKELKNLKEKHDEQDQKFYEKERELRDKIESLKDDEAKKKLGGKFHNEVVHITETIPYFGISKHYIGVINSDTVYSEGFYMRKNTLYVRMTDNNVDSVSLGECDNFYSVGADSYKLFKNETFVYGDNSPHNEKHIITIKLASKDDTDFIQQMFETKKNQIIAEIDKTRDFCISMLK